MPTPQKYLSELTVNNETYHFLDTTEHSVEVEEQSATGSAVVGESTVVEPNYIPNGDVILTTSNVSLSNVSSAGLDCGYANKRLYIYGISLSSNNVNVAVPTEASFQGAGVKLVVK